MIVLASASPRRQELLKIITADFKIVPADINESLPENITINNAAEYLAVQKSLAVAKDYPSDTVIGCDTIVVCDSEILGKPTNVDDAKRMLSLLSGRTHDVYTGVCIAKAGRTYSFTEATTVTFFEMPEQAMLDYIKSGSPLDKAGAYGIQDDFIRVYTEGIDGSFDSVMGLPAARLKKMLSKIKSE
jgi:septum formation protein